MARRRREKTAMCLPRRWNPPLGGGGGGGEAEEV